MEVLVKSCVSKLCISVMKVSKVDRVVMRKYDKTVPEFAEEKEATNEGIGYSFHYVK